MGDKLWLWYENRYHYAGPSGFWREAVVVGETRRSWLVSEVGAAGRLGPEIKLAKKDADTDPKVAWSERDRQVRDVEREVYRWIWKHAWKIEARTGDWLRTHAAEPDLAREVFHLCAKVGFDATALHDLLAERDRLRSAPEPASTSTEDTDRA